MTRPEDIGNVPSLGEVFQLPSALFQIGAWGSQEGQETPEVVSQDTDGAYTEGLRFDETGRPEDMDAEEVPVQAGGVLDWAPSGKQKTSWQLEGAVGDIRKNPGARQSHPPRASTQDQSLPGDGSLHSSLRYIRERLQTASGKKAGMALIVASMAVSGTCVYKYTSGSDPVAAAISSQKNVTGLPDVLTPLDQGLEQILTSKDAEITFVQTDGSKVTVNPFETNPDMAKAYVITQRLLGAGLYNNSRGAFPISPKENNKFVTPMVNFIRKENGEPALPDVQDLKLTDKTAQQYELASETDGAVMMSEFFANLAGAIWDDDFKVWAGGDPHKILSTNDYEELFSSIARYNKLSQHEAQRYISDAMDLMSGGNKATEVNTLLAQDKKFVSDEQQIADEQQRLGITSNNGS